MSQTPLPGDWYGEPAGSVRTLSGTHGVSVTVHRHGYNTIPERATGGSC